MTGRGIDQIMARPSDPQLYEDYVKSAVGYLQLAERRSGAIPRPVAATYIWGDALQEFERVQPDARIINLETAVTRSERPYAKTINYRMHPQNVGCLGAAKIDCCVMANNHVLDWGQAGLLETLETLHAAGIKTAGAGRNGAEAEAPAGLEMSSGGRVLVFAFACTSSGVPEAWAANGGTAGVRLLGDLSQNTVEQIAKTVSCNRAAGDIVVASLHWGGNWGYGIDERAIRFAHSLIDVAGVDLVHGHSSHHAKGIEVYRDRLVIYGCGDLINDYEGIGGNEQYRGDLGLMYFPTLADSGRVLGAELVPMRMHRFRLQRASLEDARWLSETLAREGRQFGTWVEYGSHGCLQLRWSAARPTS